MHSNWDFWEQILTLPGSPLWAACAKPLLKLVYLEPFTELFEPTASQGKGRYPTPGTTNPRVSTMPAAPSPNQLCTDIGLSIM